MNSSYSWKAYGGIDRRYSSIVVALELLDENTAGISLSWHSYAWSSSWPNLSNMNLS